MPAWRRRRQPAKPELSASVPDLLIDALDDRVRLWNKRDGLADLPPQGNRRWSRSNVICKLLGDALGVECPTTPKGAER